MRANHGFTLIECLVALLIIAIVLASTTRAITLSIDDVRASYVREAAIWVVDNQFNQYGIDKTYPNLGSTKQEVQMAGMSFLVTSTVSSTPNQYFRKVEIAVSEKRSPNYIVFKTVNFIAQY